MFRELLASLGEKVADAYHPHGTGYLLHGGYIMKCVGDAVEDEDGNVTRDNRHVIGTLAGGPDDIFAIPNPEIENSNPEVNDSIFTLEPDQQTIDPNNPVCQVCGKSISLKM